MRWSTVVALAMTACGAPRTGGRSHDEPTPASVSVDAGASISPVAPVDAALDASIAVDAGRASITFTHGAGGGTDAAKIDKASRQCDIGEMPGCHALGLALMTPGAPDSPNNHRAFAAFEKGCTGGYAPSCNGLGVMYAQGLGVARDEGKAVVLQTQACHDGNPTACLHVAHAYEGGRGVPKNATEAAAFYARACKLGAGEGCAQRRGR